MDKCFLLIFILFCFIEAVTPLKCITCHLHLKADRCRKGSGVCVAKKDATCMTLKIFKGKGMKQLYKELRAIRDSGKTTPAGARDFYTTCLGPLESVDLQLLYLECQKFCRNLTYELNNQTYVHKCCNHDYCNFEP